VYFRQLLNDETACASYLLGCKTHGALAVVEPHIDVVDEYIALAASQGASIVAVLDTHVQADHVSGLPETGMALRPLGSFSQLVVPAGR
jgi:glyoxylase-like metal-dependent hydrolase (beta-lactamase superfamily II)